MTFLCNIFKLGEMGSIGMFPLYLVDHGIPVGEVGFLTGVISQGLSILGSLAGGWMLSNQQLRYVFIAYSKALLLVVLNTVLSTFQSPIEKKNL